MSMSPSPLDVIERASVLTESLVVTFEETIRRDGTLSDAQCQVMAQGIWQVTMAMESLRESAPILFSHESHFSDALLDLCCLMGMLERGADIGLDDYRHCAPILHVMDHTARMTWDTLQRIEKRMRLVRRAAA
jgi:hypothetical protein